MTPDEHYHYERERDTMLALMRWTRAHPDESLTPALIDRLLGVRTDSHGDDVPSD